MRYIILGCLVFIYGCATVDVPSGGEKDVFAPKVMKMVPENGSTDFISNTIVIEFDEFFQLNRPSSQILISPTLDKAPDYLIKGRKLLITLNSPLKPNTTYNFYFAGAIKDLNEGNDTTFSYVFSTGNYLDSMRMQAKVMDAYTNAPVSDVWVAAYREEDSLIDAKRPDYIARTNNSGTAQFEFLPNTSFRLFALKDDNSDLMFSSFEESLGFTEERTSTQDSLFPVIRLFQPIDTALYNSGFLYSHPGKLQLIFNQEVDPESITIFDDAEAITKS